MSWDVIPSLEWSDTQLFENLFLKSGELSFLPLFCNYRVMLQMLVVASAIQASVNVLALLWLHPPFLLLAMHSYLVLVVLLVQSCGEALLVS